MIYPLLLLIMACSIEACENRIIVPQRVAAELDFRRNTPSTQLQDPCVCCAFRNRNFYAVIITWLEQPRNRSRIEDVIAKDVDARDRSNRTMFMETARLFPIYPEKLTALIQFFYNHYTNVDATDRFGSNAVYLAASTAIANNLIYEPDTCHLIHWLIVSGCKPSNPAGSWGRVNELITQADNRSKHYPAIQEMATAKLGGIVGLGALVGEYIRGDGLPDLPD